MLAPFEQNLSLLFALTWFMNTNTYSTYLQRHIRTEVSLNSGLDFYSCVFCNSKLSFWLEFYSKNSGDKKLNATQIMIPPQCARHKVQTILRKYVPFHQCLFNFFVLRRYLYPWIADQIHVAGSLLLLAS